ncbi:hypothetical protein [uncultured Oscillibacter sp.]|uniref:hypothetical protein n=1 Tax=uncultured Oscillibacter sp. TaxID=876091 RepID=UPI0025F84029|nr:hypothetical protein [uncultured Oscillibacter sp.]
MKRKRMRPRNRTAFRRVLIALAALFLVNHFLMTGLLFPIQAIRRCEERAGTGRTAVVRRDWAPEIYKTGLIYLTENETVTMLSAARLSLYGWTEVYGVPVDCTGEGPIHGGWWSFVRLEKAGRFYVFGRVDDPEIARLEVYFMRPGDPQGEERIGRVHGNFGVRREDSGWMEKDGQSYFLFETNLVDWSEYPTGLRVVAVGYDEERNVVARTDLDQGGVFAAE